MNDYKVNPRDVIEVRKRTGYNLLICKKAIISANGNIEEACNIALNLHLARIESPSDCPVIMIDHINHIHDWIRTFISRESVVICSICKKRADIIYPGMPLHDQIKLTL